MRNFIIGIFIGAGAILPGISSGVFCVAFGIYEKLINSVLNFFKDIKKNSLFLFPIILGTSIGIFLFGNLLKLLFSNFFVPTSYAIIGLILGSLPLVFKQIKISKITFTHILCLLFTFSFSLYLVVIEKVISNTSVYIDNFNLVLSGFCMSAGVVIPGVSQTVILMLLGVYEVFLDSVASLNFYILIPLGFGLILGSLALLKILQLLFKKFKSYTYFSIIGFVLGSVLILYPGFTFDFEGLISILLLLLFLFIGYKLL